MRVALYARVSTEEQATHGLSIDAQLASLDEWAKDKTVVDHYVDLGISARKAISKRPELQRLLRDVEQDKIDLIVFVKLDRWTRNIREYYKAQDILDAHGVAWRAIHEDYETETANGRLKTNLMLAISQDEADRASERIKAVFEHKRAKGLVATGTVPLGVKIVGGHYAPSKDAQKVKDIFQTYINTRSTVETGKRFGYTYAGIKHMIKNQTYLTTGIIERGTWDTAQAIMESRAQRHVRSDRVYLFSGLIVCPHCGNKLTCSYTNGYVYYRCMKHSYANCKGAFVSEIKLEKYLLNHLMSQIEEFNLTVTEKRKKVDVAALKRKQDKLTDLYVDDLINKEKYTQDYQSLQKQIDEAERDRKPIDTHEVTSLLQAYDEWSQQARKVFWSNLVRSITPTENGFIFTLNYT